MNTTTNTNANALQKEKIRNIIDGVYDVQKVRIAVGNRIVASMRPELLGSTKDMTEKEKEKAEKQKQKIINLILSEYNLITDYFVEQFKAKGRIEKAIDAVGPKNTYVKSRIDYELVQSYEELKATEKRLGDVCESLVKQHPLWDAFFSKVNGCGPLMSAVCIAYLDPYKARHCSSFWRYCGLDVRPDSNGIDKGVGKWYTEVRPYQEKGTGEIKEKRSLTYNPFVKSKLVEVLVGCFIKLGDKSEYGIIYRDYRRRMEQRDPDLKPIVHHRRAARYATKMFLRDLWVAWRTLEGLEVTEPYEVAKLGMKPHGDPMLTPEWYRALVNDYKDKYHKTWARNVEETRHIAGIPDEREIHFIMHNFDDVLTRMHTFDTSKK